VHQLALHTVGGVISAGDPIMLIVPAPRLARRRGTQSPRMRSTALSVGQPALLRFYRLQISEQLRSSNGEVSHVSADVTADQKSGASFYVARNRPCRRRRSRAWATLKLIAGMPVEAFIQTGQRTVMSYLVKPLFPIN